MPSRVGRQNGWDDLSPVTVRRYENVWKVHIREVHRQGADRHPHPLRGRAVLPPAQDRWRRSGDCSLRPFGAQPCLPAGPKVERQQAAQSGRRHRSCPSGDSTRRPNRCGPRPSKRSADLAGGREDLDARYAACLRVIAATGARRGEACALCAGRDIDWPRAD